MVFLPLLMGSGLFLFFLDFIVRVGQKFRLKRVGYGGERG